MDTENNCSHDFKSGKQVPIFSLFSGHTEAVKRLLAQLPISAQSYSSSPYLDLSLFSYDDKWVSVMERPKACGDHPIRYCVFYFFTDTVRCTRESNVFTGVCDSVHRVRGP